jgi:hypothetical protein
VPFKEDFDGKPDDVLQHIALFNHRCEETGVTQEFSYIKHENPVPSTVALTNPKEKAAWLADPDRFSYGNIHMNSGWILGGDHETMWVTKGERKVTFDI